MKPPLQIRLCYDEDVDGATTVSCEINDAGKIQVNYFCSIDTRLITDLKARAIFKDAMNDILERFIELNSGRPPISFRPPASRPERN